jgi:hypothetical protein
MRYLDFSEKIPAASRKPAPTKIGKPRIGPRYLKDIKYTNRLQSDPPSQQKIVNISQQTLRNKRVKPSMPKMPWDVE